MKSSMLLFDGVSPFHFATSDFKIPDLALEACKNAFPRFATSDDDDETGRQNYSMMKELKVVDASVF